MINPAQVEAIFFAALEKTSAAERADYLDQACGGDAALRDRVQKLLDTHPQAKNFLARTRRRSRSVQLARCDGGRDEVLLPRSARKRAHGISTLRTGMIETIDDERATMSRQPSAFCSLRRSLARWADWRITRCWRFWGAAASGPW